VLEFRILGPLEVVGEHGPLRLGGPKQRATLAILLLNVNRVVSVDRLADDLYSGATPVTAVTQVQRQISELRKALGGESVIETRSPGYLMRLQPGQLDLHRFERLTEEAARGETRLAVDLLREALDLWRGEPLADLTYEPFARTSIERLEEIRLAALEQRIEAELALGRHAEVTAELEQLVGAYPFRERFCGQLMLALYRSGRQAEALDVYRKTREALVEEFGIEPTAALRELERAILAQDRSLDLAELSHVEPARTMLVLPRDDGRLESVLAISESLAASPDRELIVARLVADEAQLRPAAAAFNSLRKSLRAGTRTAAFTTIEPGRDAVRLATSYDVDLVLIDAPPGLGEDRVPDDLATLFEHSPADVAVLAGGAMRSGGGIFVPFTGGDHDWAALELGAWLSSSVGGPLRLVGTRADPQRGQRDASRLLADASLAVQRVVGVDTEPLLVKPTAEALVAAVKDATCVVVGISPQWRREGLGETRRALVRQANAPTLLVHRGPRPGGLAPGEPRTRFTWSIET
jgi:DNA-binding SARP family transcriptional activator/nucleotide-binding universal stress UspA family protein